MIVAFAFGGGEARILTNATPKKTVVVDHAQQLCLCGCVRSESADKAANQLTSTAKFEPETANWKANDISLIS